MDLTVFAVLLLLLGAVCERCMHGLEADRVSSVPGHYISPSDKIMSPCTKKLSDLKGKRFKKWVSLVLCFLLSDLSIRRKKTFSDTNMHRSVLASLRTLLPRPLARNRLKAD